ncbi:MAG: ERF family protein [Clostridia bacterium]|nr:ERF family protein [Clostridia bacterium]
MLEEKLNLNQKLARIRKIADVVTKSKKGFNYSFADISDILAKIKAGMERYGVSLVPTITPGTMQVEKVVSVNTKLDRQGKSYDVTSTEYLARAEMVFLWLDDETGESREVPWNVVGAQSDPSQAFGSGLTYCTRYFLTNYFQIPQVETDVDTYRSKQREAEAAEDLSIAKSIIDQLDTDIRIKKRVRV